MSSVRPSAAGATRLCPHCRAVILQSATSCPACKKHLRFEPGAAARAVILQSATSCPACKKHLRFEPGAAARAAPSFSALRLEGALRHPENGQAWEYSVLVTVRNDKGEEVSRQVVGVGAIQPGEGRNFTFSVEVFKPGESKLSGA